MARYSTNMSAVPERGAPPEKPLAQYLTRAYNFSTQDDQVEAMAMGKELFEAAARIVRERKGKYTLEQTANYLESLAGQDSAGTANSPSPEVRQAWVSVTEKFPPDNQPVLVLRMQIEYYCKNVDGEMDTNVTHWMPIPPGPAAPPATKEKTAGAEKGGAN